MPIATPDHLALKLPADAYYHLVRTLCLTLPPPPSDGPDALAQRNHAAITRIAALIPANPAEADLAAQFVAASEQWKDCLRLAQLPATTPEIALKCRAQALSMMREAKSALRLLLRLQGNAAEAGGEQRRLQPRRLDRTLRHRPDGRGAVPAARDAGAASPVR